MAFISYDFVDEYVSNFLSNLFQTKHHDEEIYRKHSLENLDFFRNIKNDFVVIKEESRFINIRICFNSIIPNIQIFINKDNNRLSRVYINNYDNKLGPMFDIDDEKIIDLINLQPQLISNMTNIIIQIKENEKENLVLVSQISDFISETINQRNQKLKEKISAEVFPTYYGFCLILTTGRLKVLQIRYRFNKNTIKKSEAVTDEKLQKFVEKKVDHFIKEQEQFFKRKQ